MPPPPRPSHVEFLDAVAAALETVGVGALLKDGAGESDVVSGQAGPAAQGCQLEPKAERCMDQRRRIPPWNVKVKSDSERM